MCTTPILAMSNFTNTFVLGCDDLCKDLGMVLQGWHPLDFTNKKLCDGNLDKSTYEKEIMDILHAMDTRNLYLIARNFQIKTNHHSLN